MKTILKIENVSMDFPVKSTMKEVLNREAKKTISAVHQISLDIKENEVLSLVGESGCGKSTLAKVMIQLLDGYEGAVIYKDENVKAMSKSWIGNEFRPDIQMVFQDPYSCLNPKKKICNTLLEVLNVHQIGKRDERKQMVKDILKTCGLQESMMDKYPGELSGGQCQRIGIARALLTNPKIIIADEPISALDVSVQAQIINMLLDLKEERNLTVVFISHDLEIVKYLSDRIAVMYLGEIVELATKEALYDHPVHPYTKLLLSSVPKIYSEEESDEKEDIFEEMSELPNIMNLPKGCRFQTRCPYVTDKCKMEAPKLTQKEEGHFVACWNK